MSQFSLNEIQPINTTCARIPINLLKSEHSKIVKNPILVSASNIATKGGDSWTTPLTLLNPLLDDKTQDVKQLVFPKRTVVQSKYPISNRPRVQHLMTVIEKKLDIVSFKKNKSERDKKKRQFSNLWQFKLGHSTQALGAGGHKTPHNFKKGRGVCIRPIVDRQLPKWKKDLYLACDDLINEIDPEFAKDGHYAVNFSCMTDAQKHFVKVHTDSHDISHQYGIVLGNTKGGRLTCWNKNGTTQTVDYHRKILKMDGRLQHTVGNFTGKRYCVIFYKLYDPRKSCCDPIFAPARLI